MERGTDLKKANTGMVYAIDLDARRYSKSITFFHHLDLLVIFATRAEYEAIAKSAGGAVPFTVSRASPVIQAKDVFDTFKLRLPSPFDDGYIISDAGDVSAKSNTTLTFPSSQTQSKTKASGGSSTVKDYEASLVRRPDGDIISMWVQ